MHGHHYPEMIRWCGLRVGDRSASLRLALNRLSVWVYTPHGRKTPKIELGATRWGILLPVDVGYSQQDVRGEWGARRLERRVHGAD